MNKSVEELLEKGIRKGLLQIQDGKITYVHHKKTKREKPEERVRAAAYVFLTEDLNYSLDQIAPPEVSIQLGAGRWDYADLVVYQDETKINPFIIVETKRPKRQDGLGQLELYMNATGAPLGWWWNGTDEVFRYRVEPNIFTDLPRLPTKGERIEDIGRELRRRDLTPAIDLESDFKAWEDYILAHQGVDVFNELFKVFYAKLFDEHSLKNDGDICQFRAAINEPPDSINKKVQELLERAIAEWGILQSNERIELIPPVLAYIVSRLQRYYLWKTDIDVLGTAFEYLVTKVMKGEKGQFFTPRTVIGMMGKIAQVSWSKKILDPACGSGGFLVWAMNQVWDEVERKEKNPKKIARGQYEYSNQKLFGIDYEARMVKIAQVNMLIREDSRTNIFVANSLRDYEWQYPLTRYVQPNTFDIILTNPPFAGAIKNPTILSKFTLAYKNGKPVKAQTRQLLFLEMCLKYLRPRGRLAIVLPKGVFNNPTLKYVRDFIHNQAQILACVSLNPYVFAPHTGNRAGVLVLEKRKPEEKDQEYEIFMAISLKSGKKQGGRPLYKTLPTSELILDNEGKPILDSDLADIAETFLSHKIPPELAERCFYVKKSDLKDRIDPEYYQPISSKFMDAVRRSGQELKPLKDLCDYVRESMDLNKKPEEIFRYIELDDVNSLGMIERTKTIVGRDAPSRARLVVRSGDIITAMSGSKTGSPFRHRAAIITNEHDNCIVSTGFGVLRPKEEINVYFLYGLLKSPYVLNEMRRKLQGGGIPKISEDDLMEILVPVPPKKQRNEVGEKIKNGLETLVHGRTQIEDVFRKMQSSLKLTFLELPEVEIEEIEESE